MIPATKGTQSFSHGKLVLLIGPSGVGKSVILRRLRRGHPEWHFPRSVTTRSRRSGEGDELYYFVTGAEFDRFLAKGELLESAVVHESARYGTLVSEIIPAIEQGKTVLREVDVQGFLHIRAHPFFSGEDARYPLQSIFILPESREQLVTHITKRAPIAEEELERRLQSMDRELAFAESCTHRVVNREGDMEGTLCQVEALIVESDMKDSE